jgi:competence protein ComEC
MEKLNQFPFVKIIIPFCIGIYLGIFQNIYFPILFLSIPILLFLISLLKKFRNKRIWQGTSYFVFFIVLGNTLSYYNNELYRKNHFSKIAKNNNDYLIGYIDESPTTKGESYKTVVQINKVFDGKKDYSACGNLLVYFKKEALSDKIKYGQNVIIKANFNEFTSPPNPFQFSAKEYYCFKNIYHVQFSDIGNFRFLSGYSGNYFQKFALETRDNLIDMYDKFKIPQDELSVLKALVLGYDDDVSDEVILTYSATGVMHILSVSGLHIGVVYLVLRYLLSFLNGNRKKELLKLILLIAFLWTYALITGFSSSVVRAALMFSLFSIGTYYKFFNNIFNILSFSAFVLLVIDPFYLANVGFQLSYFALLGILLIQPLFAKWYSSENYIVNFIYSTSTVSIAATIGTLAFNLYYYHQFPLYFIPANIIAIPLSTVIIYGGFLLIPLSLFSKIGALFSLLLTKTITILNSSLNYIDSLPNSNLQPISFTKIEGFVLIVATFFLVMFYYHKSKKLFYAFIFTSLIFIATSNYLYFKNSNSSQLLVYKIKHQTAIEVSSKGESVFLSKKELFDNQWMQKFHCQPYRSNYYISKTKWISDSVFESRNYSKTYFGLKENIIVVGQAKFLLLNQVNYHLMQDQEFINNFKGIILSGSFKFFNIKNKVKPILVFDSSFNNPFKSSILAKLKKSNQNFWDVTTMGAFFYEQKSNLINS